MLRLDRSFAERLSAPKLCDAPRDLKELRVDIIFEIGPKATRSIAVMLKLIRIASLGLLRRFAFFARASLRALALIGEPEAEITLYHRALMPSRRHRQRAHRAEIELKLFERGGHQLMMDQGLAAEGRLPRVFHARAEGGLGDANAFKGVK